MLTPFLPSNWWLPSFEDLFITHFLRSGLVPPSLSKTIKPIIVPVPKSQPLPILWPVLHPPPLGLLQRVHNFPNGEEVLAVEHGTPIYPPMVNASDDPFVLAGLASGLQVVEEGIDNGVGGRKLAPQPVDEWVPIIRNPGPLLLLLLVVRASSNRNGGVCWWCCHHMLVID